MIFAAAVLIIQDSAVPICIIHLSGYGRILQHFIFQPVILVSWKDMFRTPAVPGQLPGHRHREKAVHKLFDFRSYKTAHHQNPSASSTRITLILPLIFENLVIRIWQQIVSGDLQS